MKKLAVAGAVGFTDDGVPLLDAELVRRAMEISAELDMPISFHEEDPKYIENNGVNRERPASITVSAVLPERRRSRWWSGT